MPAIKAGSIKRAFLNIQSWVSSKLLKSHSCNKHVHFISLRERQKCGIVTLDRELGVDLALIKSSL